MDFEESRIPGPEHAFLAEQVGEWKASVSLWLDPAAPPAVSEVRAERTMKLGGRVLEERLTGELMGMPYESIGQLGYDKVIDRWWSTGSDNFGTGVFFLTGTLDPATGRGTFEGQGSVAELDRQVPIRHETRIEGEAQIIELYMPGPGGEPVRTMRFDYERA